MPVSETILAPNQQHAIALIEDFVESGESTAKLVSPRGCGTTTLFHALLRYQGFGDLPIEFIYRCVRSTQAPQSSLPCPIDQLQHRVVFLLDRATSSATVSDLAMQSDQIQWIQAVAPSRFSALSSASRQLDLRPLNQEQIRRFVELQNFTSKGRLVKFSTQTIKDLAHQSEGRLRDLMPLIQTYLSSSSKRARTPKPPLTATAFTTRLRSANSLSKAA